MQLTWGMLVLIVIAAAVGWLWRDGLRVRDSANVAAIEACTRLGLQFLDGTVAFAQWQLVRDVGQLRLRRTYVFDYTAHSIDRLQGFVMLLGMRVESVGFARDEGQPARPTVTDAAAPTSWPATSIDTVPDSTSSKILDLDDWRRARDRRH